MATMTLWKADTFWSNFRMSTSGPGDGFPNGSNYTIISRCNTQVDKIFVMYDKWCIAIDAAGTSDLVLAQGVQHITI